MSIRVTHGPARCSPGHAQLTKLASGGSAGQREYWLDWGWRRIQREWIQQRWIVQAIGWTRETNAKTFSPLISVSDGNGEWALAMKTNDRISTTIARIAISRNFSSLPSCAGSSTKAPCAVFNWRNLSIFFIILILNSQTFSIGADVAFTLHTSFYAWSYCWHGLVWWASADSEKHKKRGVTHQPTPSVTVTRWPRISRLAPHLTHLPSCPKCVTHINILLYEGFIDDFWGFSDR